MKATFEGIRKEFRKAPVKVLQENKDNEFLALAVPGKGILHIVYVGINNDKQYLEFRLHEFMEISNDPELYKELLSLNSELIQGKLSINEDNGRVSFRINLVFDDSKNLSPKLFHRSLISMMVFLHNDYEHLMKFASKVDNNVIENSFNRFNMPSVN